MKIAYLHKMCITFNAINMNSRWYEKFSSVPGFQFPFDINIHV